MRGLKVRSQAIGFCFTPHMIKVREVNVSERFSRKKAQVEEAKERAFTSSRNTRINTKVKEFEDYDRSLRTVIYNTILTCLF